MVRHNGWLFKRQGQRAWETGKTLIFPTGHGRRPGIDPMADTGLPHTRVKRYCDNLLPDSDRIRKRLRTRFRLASDKLQDIRAIRIRRNLPQANLGMLTHQLAQMDALLLAADYVAPPLAERLRALNIEFVDGVGNAYVHPLQPQFVAFSSRLTLKLVIVAPFARFGRIRGFRPAIFNLRRARCILSF